MASLVIVTHEFDAFAYRLPQAPEKVVSPYLLFDVLRHLETMGHSWRVATGASPLPGDAALLHVDSTIVHEEYLALRSRYACTINFGTADISKRKVSRSLLNEDDSWDGPVIIKANLNNSAIMEDIHNRKALRLGRSVPHPGVSRCAEYRVVSSLRNVPEGVWEDPALVVERFVPEPADEGDGFVLRTWVFMGPRERCTRMVTPTSLSKAGDVIRYEAIQVPPELRAERERLKFDFGKFDFVMHDGAPILLDANRTPGVAAAIRPMMKAGARNLAEGLNALLKQEL